MSDTTSAYPSDILNPALDEGLRTLSRDEEIVFTQYIRKVLPLDGYVFWLATQSTAFRGSLHYSSNSEQREDESITINRVVFSTSTEIEAFNDIAPNTVWIADYQGMKFAFSQRGYLYSTARIFHYAGDAVYPVMYSQLMNVGDEFPDTTLIVSNSLPAWLRLVDYSPIWLVAPNPGITLYPSFAVPDNIRPPYGTVHIDPTGTRALAAFPNLARRGTHRQLATDHVRVTLYGLTNDQAEDWQDTLNQYSYDGDVLGMMSTPIMRDEKRTQNELNILAMKKTFELDVSYNQLRVRDVARQMVEEASAVLYPSDLIPC